MTDLQAAVLILIGIVNVLIWVELIRTIWREL